MNNNNYITIQGWMVNELHLCGNELVCYAIIYGFSQDGKFWDGSLTYLSEWMGVSRRTAINVINSLITKGYIEKQDYEVNNVKFCKYRAIAPIFIGSEKIALGGGENFSPCINNSIYTKKEIEDKSSISKEKLDFDEIKAKWKEFNPNLKQPRMISDERKNAIRLLLKKNNATIDDLYKAFAMISISSYCNANHERNRTWKATFDWLIYDTKGCFNRLLEGQYAYTQSESDMAEKIKKGDYDVQSAIRNAYHPWGNNAIMWNDLYKCWLSIDDFQGKVIDGYTDDNRPDGAQIVLHNARGTITWSKAEKKWNIEMKSPWG